MICSMVVSNITLHTSDTRHYSQISLYMFSSLCLSVPESISGCCLGVEVLCNISVGVFSPSSDFGRSRNLKVGTDDDVVNSLSSVDLRESYVISAVSVSTHGDIVWNTELLIAHSVP